MPILILTARDATEEKVQQLRGGRGRLPHQALCLCRARHAREGAAATRTGGALERAAGGGPGGRPAHAAGAPGGRRIELTPKEYALLEYLAANPGRVFSRTMIIEHVWDQSFEGLTNIVDVYVRHLRAKVDDPYPVKLIRTVRGVGYGLNDSAAP